MADDFFGPASDLAVTTRPTLTPQTPRPGASPSWFSPCSAAGASDGTKVAAEFLNHLVGNLDAVRTRAGITSAIVAATSDDILVESILALISAYTLPYIAAPVTIYVSTAGTASPASPLTGGAFDKLSSAMTWLRGRRITSTGYVTVSIGAGVFAEAAQVDLSHLDGQRIEIVGSALLGAFPTTVVSTVKATAEADLRAIWATQINAPYGVICKSPLARFARIGIFGSVAGQGLSFGHTPSFPTTDRFGLATAFVDEVAIHGYANGLLSRQGAHCIAQKVVASHSSESGILVNNSAYLLATSLRVGSSGSHGVWAREKSSVEATDSHSDNSAAGAGLYAVNDSEIIWTGTGDASSNGCTTRTNSIGSARAYRWSKILLTNVNGNGNSAGTSIRSDVGSSIEAVGCINLSGTISPTSGTTGNNDSYNWVH